MDTADPKDETAVDQATADRLARLRSMPVDTSRLEKSLRAQIRRPEHDAEGAAPRPLRIAWFRPFRAVAASFLLLSAVVALVLLISSGGPALASPSHMAQMHQELVSGRTPVVQVSSIDEANRALAGQWPPTLTRGGVTYHVQSTGDLNMVMTERHGRWVCLIGRVPAERLMDVTSKLEF
jgi:hypothetical protein